MANYICGLTLNSKVMENNVKKQQRDVMEIRDAYNDEYWLKKYGVSSDELKSTEEIGISAKIIEVNEKNHVYSN